MKRLTKKPYHAQTTISIPPQLIFTFLLPCHPLHASTNTTYIPTQQTFTIITITKTTNQFNTIPNKNHITIYTGITSIFDASSQLNTTPSKLAGNILLLHWHPVVKGSGGATIISTFSFLCTTPITLTVLPSLIYLTNTKKHSISFIPTTALNSILLQISSLLHLSPLLPFFPFM